MIEKYGEYLNFKHYSVTLLLISLKIPSLVSDTNTSSFLPPSEAALEVSFVALGVIQIVDRNRYKSFLFS